MQKDKITTVKVSKSSQKTSARLYAVQAIYEHLTTKKGAETIVREYIAHRLEKPLDDQRELAQPDKELFSATVQGTYDRIDDLTNIIKRSQTGKAADKNLEPLLFSILLCGGYELMARHDIDAPIIISDYIDITHAFYEQGEAKLVNAILDRIKSNVRD